MPLMISTWRLILLGLVCIVISCCSSKKTLDEKLVLLKNGKPLAGAVVITNITGRNLHWWDDPTISGDWQTPQSEIMENQEIVSKTDKDGIFHVQGKGVFLNIIAFDDLKGHVVFSSKISVFKKIPTRLELSHAQLTYPINFFGSHAALEEFEEDACLLFVSVDLPSGKPAYNLPYEVFFHGTNKAFLKYVTDERGYIHILLPCQSSYDVVIRPGKSTWPGLNPFFIRVPEHLKNDQEIIDRIVRENPNIEYEHNDLESAFWDGYRSFAPVPVRAPKPFKKVKLSNLKPTLNSAKQIPQESVVLERIDAPGQTESRGAVITPK